jgi:glutaminase
MTPDDIQSYLNDLTARMMAQDNWGTPAGYIPELKNIDPAQFAIAVALADGSLLSAGSADKRFSIQSISKVFTLSIALGRVGDTLWSRVGREPSGNRFDSILQLEQEKGRPRNPFINAGAIVTTDSLLTGRAPKDTLSEILLFIRAAAGDDDIHINKDVAQSEKDTGFRNMALAYYLQSHGNLLNHPDLTLGTYYHQCAIDMTTRQLALAGRYLAGLEGAPRMIGAAKTRRVNALMMTCGHYDGSGDFAYRVGLPAKSGVGGGLLIVAPQKASIAIWSPGLNAYGNSKVGTEAAQCLSTDLGWSVF